MIQGAAFRVLACFHNQDARGFVELCNMAGYPTDLGGYYIRQLLQGGYIKKHERGQYRLSPLGKQQLAVNYGKPLLLEKPRLAVLLVAKQEDAFIVLRRRVQPFLGAAEWPAGVVRHGESMAVAAERVAQERFGLASDARMVGFFRRIDMYDDFIFDDKIFAIHALEVAKEVQLTIEAKTGQNIWCTKQELYRLDKPSKSLLDIFEYTQTNQTGFVEKNYQLTSSDFYPSEKV